MGKFVVDLSNIKEYNGNIVKKHLCLVETQMTMKMAWKGAKRLFNPARLQSLWLAMTERDYFQKKKLVFSGLLVLLVCIMFGCGGQSKEIGAESKAQEDKSVEVKVESKEQEVETKEQLKIQPKNETNQIKPDELSQKELEEKVVKIVATMEKYCSGLDKPHVDRLAVDLILDYPLGKLLKIGTAATPILIEVVKDKKRHWYLRVVLSKFIGAEGGLNDNRIDEPLIEILKDRNEDKIVRAEASSTLAESNLISSDLLCQILSTETDERLREEIIRSFTYVGDEKAIKPLLEILNNKNEDGLTRKLAAWSLGSIGYHTGDKSMVEPLIEVLKTTKNADVYIGVVNALGWLKDKRAIEPLIEELKKGSMWGVAEGLGSLWQAGIHDDRIIEALIEVLKHKDGVVVGNAAKELGEIGDKRGIEPLEIALINVKIRGGYEERMIIYALADIAEREEGERERVIKILEKTLRNTMDEQERADIAIGLGKIRDKRAVNLLIEILEEAIKDKDKKVIYSSSFALCKIGDRKAVPYVEKALKKGRWIDYQKEWVVEELKQLTGKDYKY